MCKNLVREEEVRKRVADGEGGCVLPTDVRGAPCLAEEPLLQVPPPPATRPCASFRASASSVGPMWALCGSF